MGTRIVAQQNLAKRKSKGGRPKGTKNRTTILREAIENDLQDYVHQSAKEVIQVIVDQALKGCRPSQKLLVDRVIAPKRAEGDDNVRGTPQIVINVSGMKEEGVDFIEAERDDDDG